MFQQEFERLAKHTHITTAQRPVSQIRLCIEGLRKLVDGAGSVSGLDGDYVLAAYETLLHQFGTSYEEVRLAHGATEDKRRALAQRLGIDRNPQWSDYLNFLPLEPEQITEAKLESLFGLVDTTQDPFTPRPSGQLFEWQLFQLRSLWLEQDRARTELVIDPDVIGRADFAKTDPMDPAFALWKKRHDELQEKYQLLGEDRAAQPSALAGLQKIVGDILNPLINHPETPVSQIPCNDSQGAPLPALEFLFCMDEQHKNGKNIQPLLNALHLDLAAMRYLIRIRNLANNAGPEVVVADEEWEDVYHILTHVWKVSQTKSWRVDEKDIAISPDFFKLYDAAAPSLPSTGVLDGALLADGSEDPRWILRAAPAGVSGVPNAKVYVARPQPLAWVPNSDRSHWVSPNQNGNDDSPIGDYIFQSHFNLSGWDPKTVEIVARISVDDELTDITLNGKSLGLKAKGYKAFTTLPLKPELLLDGENVVEFLVSNNGLATASPIGLRVELLFASPPRPYQLPLWRVAERARSDWQAMLRSRIEQEEGLRLAFDSGVLATEEVTLPLLRDTLIKVLAAQQMMAPTDAADWLSERLLIETKGGGWRLTTRVLQAIETVQSLVFSLRTQRFTEGHPARGWEIPFGNAGGDTQTEFDEEWAWAANYESWRAAMLVFYYPENILLPSLRELSHSTVPPKAEPFENFLLDLRATSRLTPDAAENFAAKYLENIFNPEVVGSKPRPTELQGFAITEKRNNEELSALRKKANQLLPNFGKSSEEYLKEIFYFVPMALALQLQKSGEYTAALDWFQTVYAYNLPGKDQKGEDERYIYPGLSAERNRAPIISRLGHWMRDGLNPHTLATDRAYPGPLDAGSNPYTRFTLMALARCFLEFADAEFTRDTGESLARARSLYLSARDVLSSPEFDQIQPLEMEATLLPNPVLQALRRRIENQLAKMRQGRNVAGMRRELEIPTPPRTFVGLPTVGSGGQLVIPGTRCPLKPTPYRFAVLMERAKHLVNIAQQIEAAYLAALEKRDGANYDLKKAGFDLQLAEAGKRLQELRETEAINGVALIAKQRSRATRQKNTYKQWIDDGLSNSEKLLIKNYRDAGIAQVLGANLAAGLTISQAWTTAATAEFGAPAAAVGAATTSVLATAKAIHDVVAIQAQTEAQVLSLTGSHERRVNDWQLALDLADIEEQIADQQKIIAEDHTKIVKQEKNIAEAQTTQARAMAEYLANKFTNADLYEWMSGILGGVYSYFLQQATSVAMLAENQLTFERQEAPTSLIQGDYWEAPPEGSTTKSDEQKKDRRGLTGSARLLQDIYQLDQYAFETNKRKLNLTHTISLAMLDPFAFAVFRDTGVLNFNTPVRLYDEAFPGHFLRLIKRVRTSVVALIPPVLGIRATLTASGVSRVVTGGDVFQETTIRRDPELVALSSPVNATGVFELDAQSELLMPFESMGVDTRWEFVMPKASNPFAFDTIADVLVTLEYTALFNEDYRRQVIQQFDPRVNADKAYSIRNDYPDIWYDLNNTGGPSGKSEIHFRSERSEFPPNLDDDITIREILFAVLTKEKKITIDGEVTLSYQPDFPEGASPINGAVAMDNGRIHTRLPGGKAAWGGIQGKRAVGAWQFGLSNDIGVHLKNGVIHDILVVVTFAGAKPSWPS